MNIGTIDMASRWSARVITRLLFCLAAAAFYAPGSAFADDFACDSLDDFPCMVQVEAQALSAAPILFKVQARVVQGGMPIESAKFGKSFVHLKQGGSIVCTEKYLQVDIKNSLINMEIGPEMDCEIDEELISGENLSFVLCLNGQESCGPPIPLLAAPQAIRATYAWRANRTHRAERTGQAHYTHRFSADGLDLAGRNVISFGYFDMTTPDAAAAAPLYDEEQFAAYRDGGFLQWTPVLDRQAMNVHLVGRDSGYGKLKSLKELVLASAETRASEVRVETNSKVGLTVESRGADITGDTTLSGDLLVLGEMLVDGDLVALKGGSLAGTTLVGSGMVLTAGTLTVTGDSVFHDLTTVSAQTSVSGDATVAGPSQVAGTLTATELEVIDNLQVEPGGNALLSSLQVNGAAEITDSAAATGLVVNGDAALGEMVTVSGGMTVVGDATFNGLVTFEGGRSTPNEPLDTRYVQFANENRDLAFGGVMTLAGGATLATDLAGNFNQLEKSLFHTSATAPAACTNDNVGLVFFDLSRHALRVCVNGRFKPLGGGGGVCGNALVEQDSENCDDGNQVAGDGCGTLCDVEKGWTCAGVPSKCTITCGDGIVVAGLEECDDGNVQAGDGCSPLCKVEVEWSCAGEPSACDACGNGVVAGTEECDDGPGMHVNGDGCNVICEVESGWTCQGDPSECQSNCGDGIIVGTEECDDGPNLHEDGDGCSIFCAKEEGWYCSGEPSNCSTKCNDGIVAGAETCDDGDAQSGDGCNSACLVEAGWTCAEDLDLPSVCWKCDAELEGHCYLLKCGANVNEEWAKARAICYDHGGYLLRIDSQEENDLVDAMNVGCATEIYLGLTDAGSQGNYRWVTESGGGKPSYTNWGYGQPDETSSDKHCAYVEELNDEAVWWDGSCSADRAYICEIPPK